MHLRAAQGDLKLRPRRTKSASWRTTKGAPQRCLMGSQTASFANGQGELETHESCAWKAFNGIGVETQRERTSKLPNGIWKCQLCEAPIGSEVYQRHASKLPKGRGPPAAAPPQCSSAPWGPTAPTAARRTSRTTRSDPGERPSPWRPIPPWSGCRSAAQR